MKLSLVCSLALAATAMVPAAERITFAEVSGRARGRTLPVAVLVLLHGRGRHHRSLIDSPVARDALLTAAFYVVLPQGEDGWYLDSPAQPAARYAAYLAEVVAWAERTLPVGRTAARRGIAGWSMGGYGAVRCAETHPGKFGFVASVIGLLDFPRAETLPEGQNYKVPIARFTADPATWAALNPLNSVDQLRGTALTLVLATKGFERTMNEHFLAALAAQTPPLPARVHRLEGGHEFSLVERAIPLVLADAAEFFHKASAIPLPSTP